MRVRQQYLIAFLLLSSPGCEPENPTLRPDAILLEELGLSKDDRVHTVRLTTKGQERASPDSILVEEGDYVQFVSDDWFIHEVFFDSMTMSDSAWTFMVSNDQSASPPLLQNGARFVISLVGASSGAYRFLLEGNREPGFGVIVVAPPPSIP